MSKYSNLEERVRFLEYQVRILKVERLSQWGKEAINTIKTKNENKSAANPDLEKVKQARPDILCTNVMCNVIRSAPCERLCPRIHRG